MYFVTGDWTELLPLAAIAGSFARSLSVLIAKAPAAPMKLPMTLESCDAARYAVPAPCGVPPVFTIVSLTCWPPMPPLALSSSTASRIPFMKSGPP